MFRKLGQAVFSARPTLFRRIETRKTESDTGFCATDRLWILKQLEGVSSHAVETLCSLSLIPRKEVIQPHLPIRLPCYDFTPVMKRTVVGGPLAVSLPTSGAPHSHGVTGGVYKTRERIHRDMLIRDY